MGVLGSEFEGVSAILEGELGGFKEARYSRSDMALSRLCGFRVTRDGLDGLISEDSERGERGAVSEDRDIGLISEDRGFSSQDRVRERGLGGRAGFRAGSCKSFLGSAETWLLGDGRSVLGGAGDRTTGESAAGSRFWRTRRSVCGEAGVELGSGDRDSFSFLGMTGFRAGSGIRALALEGGHTGSFGVSGGGFSGFFAARADIGEGWASGARAVLFTMLSFAFAPIGVNCWGLKGANEGEGEGGSGRDPTPCAVPVVAHFACFPAKISACLDIGCGCRGVGGAMVLTGALAGAFTTAAEAARGTEVSPGLVVWRDL